MRTPWPRLHPCCLLVHRSTSFANPAVTFARMFSNTFAGIAPVSVAMFVAMQLVGGILGYTAIRVLYPDANAVATELTAHPTTATRNGLSPL